MCYKSTVLYPLWPLLISKWLPIAKICLHILFVLIKTNILKKKLLKLDLKKRSYDFGWCPLSTPYISETVRATSKPLPLYQNVFLYRMQRKKPRQNPIKNKHSMSKIMKVPFFGPFNPFSDTDERSRSKPWKGISACHKQPTYQISWKKSKGFYWFPCLQEKITDRQTDKVITIGHPTRGALINE